MAIHEYDGMSGINAVLVDGYLKQIFRLLKTAEEVAREPDVSWSSPTA